MKIRQPFFTLLLRLAVLAICITFAACGSKSKECINSSDQRASYGAPLGSNDPVKMIVDTAFSTDERSAIAKAAETWNAYGRGSLGRSFFTVQVGAPDANSQDIPKTKDDKNFGTDDSGSVHVIRITDPAVWSSLSLTKANPAVTIRVTENDDLKKQVILVFPDYLDPQELQMTTTLVHEGGHALGIDHSCSFSSTDGLVSCNGLAADHPYHQAVMYPVMRLGTEPASPSSTNVGITNGSNRNQSATYIQPEIKEDLRQNDKDRANCQYQP